MSPEPWFAPKAHGYGAGLPIRWQGWAVLAGYLTATVGAVVALPWWAALAVTAAASALLLRVAARRTAGGWRWRG